MSLTTSTKFAQPLPLNTTSSRSKEHKLLFDPFRTNSFLGSTHKLRFNSLSKSNQINIHRRSAIVAVSDVVKEKKSKSSTNLVIILQPHFSFFVFGFSLMRIINRLMRIQSCKIPTFWENFIYPESWLKEKLF